MSSLSRASEVPRSPRVSVDRSYGGGGTHEDGGSSSCYGLLSHISYPDAIETECHTFTDYGFVGILDGVTVAKSIVLKDKFENLGAR
jgi:hypothetical protein